MATSECGVRQLATMSDNDDELDRNGIELDRRTAMKGGAAGLAALGIGSLGTGSVVADHDPANKVAAAGSSREILEVAKQNSDNISTFHDLLGPVSVKTSNDEKQSLVLQPTVESTLLTDVKVKGNDESSTAKAGLLGWIELQGDATGGETRMVTVDGHYDASPPDSASDLVAVLEGEQADTEGWREGVVALNTRDFKMEWDLADLEDDDWLQVHLLTRSANGFNWIARDVGGTNEITFRGVLYVYVDDDNAEAQAGVGNRTMVMDPMKIHHEVS